MKIQELLETEQLSKEKLKDYVKNTFGLSPHSFDVFNNELVLNYHAICVRSIDELSVPIAVAQSMYISANLKSLKNCPREVNKGFVLQELSKIKDLTNSPKSIGGTFTILECDIQSTKGITQHCSSFAFDLCSDLENFEGMPPILESLRISQCASIENLSQVFDHVKGISVDLIISGQFVNHLAGFHRILMLNPLPQNVRIVDTGMSLSIEKLFKDSIKRIKSGEKRSIVILDFQDALADMNMEKNF